MFDESEVIEVFMAKAIEDIERMESLAALEAHLTNVRDEIGATHLLYHWINTGGELIGAGTYTDAWRQHYIANGYQNVDPVVKAAAQGFHLIQWAKLDWSGRRARQLMEDSATFGVGNHGMTIPIHGPKGQFAHLTATLSGTTTDWEAFTARNGRALILLGHFTNRKVLEICGCLEQDERIALSPRETDALTFLAMGYSRGQAADMLSISEHTLRVYIESARHKLDAANTTAAIARAVKMGLLVI